jgi:hypothetical protein
VLEVTPVERDVDKVAIEAIHMHKMHKVLLQVPEHIFDETLLEMQYICV